MLNNFILSLGHLVLLYKSLNIKLPIEIQDFLESNPIIMMVLSFIYLRSMINDNLTVFVVVSLFSWYVYYDIFNEITDNYQIIGELNKKKGELNKNETKLGSNISLFR